VLAVMVSKVHLGIRGDKADIVMRDILFSLMLQEARSSKTHQLRFIRCGKIPQGRFALPDRPLI
jgi:hypothetical protein